MVSINNKLFILTKLLSGANFLHEILLRTTTYSRQRGTNEVLGVGGFIPLPVPTLSTPSTANEAARSNLLRFFAS